MIVLHAVSRYGMGTSRNSPASGSNWR
jgi:hypothetical protein